MIYQLPMSQKPSQSLTDQAYLALEEEIVTLVLEPGQVLSEHTLAASLGIGRTPVREALQRLARERLVVVLPRRGIMVSQIDVRQQLELLRVRRELERLMAGLASQRATELERRRFLEIASAMNLAGAEDDDKGFMRLDQELNQLVAHACRNDFARGAMSLMHGLSRRFWYVHYREVLDLPLCADLHAALAQAIGSADPLRAAQASDALINYIESFTRKSVDMTPE